jgi:hypothetical protein
MSIIHFGLRIAGAWRSRTRDGAEVEVLVANGNIIELRGVVDAVRCAIEVRSGMVERNDG